ncbi:MAG: hypothetical protein ACPL7I_03310, partial [Myxococcota bacterium]
MKRVILFTLFIFLSQSLFAEEGFYLSLGLGSDIFFGEQMPKETIYKNGSPVTIISGNSSREATTDIVSTDLGGMFAVDFNM